MKRTITKHWRHIGNSNHCLCSLQIVLVHQHSVAMNENHENNRITFFLFWNAHWLQEYSIYTVQQTLASAKPQFVLFQIPNELYCRWFFGQDTFIAQRDAHEDLVQETYWVDARTRVLKNVMEVPAPGFEVILGTWLCAEINLNIFLT